jgi:hypothetical protein
MFSAQIAQHGALQTDNVSSQRHIVTSRDKSCETTVSPDSSQAASTAPGLAGRIAWADHGTAFAGTVVLMAKRPILGSGPFLVMLGESPQDTTPSTPGTARSWTRALRLLPCSSPQMPGVMTRHAAWPVGYAPAAS